MSEPRWLAEARKDLGIKEGPGATDNPKVVQMYRDCNCDWAKHDAVAWCAAAVGSWLKRAGLKGTQSLLAVSYKNWGQPLAGPVVGAIMWMPRVGGSGHVGIVESTSPGRVNLLAGNQGDKVCIASVPRTAQQAFRWPPGQPLPSAARAPKAEHPPAKIRKSYFRGKRHG
jgi:uncharacterized protein (TIGR02594 family)